MREVLAGVELELGDLRADRDRATKRAEAADRFAEAQRARAARAELLPWVLAPTALIVGVIAGAIIGVYVERSR